MPRSRAPALAAAALAAALPLAGAALAQSNAPRPIAPPPILVPRPPPALVPNPLRDDPARLRPPQTRDGGPGAAAPAPRREPARTLAPAGGARFAAPPPPPPPRPGSFAAPDPVAAGGFDPDETEPGVVVVALAPGLDAAAGEALAAELDLATIDAAAVGLLDALVLRLRVPADRTVEDALGALAGDARVAYAGPSRVYRTQGSGAQYALARLGLEPPAATEGGRGVVVAVVDTRADLAHPELSGARVREASVLPQEGPPLDHGTQIVGLIAGAGLLRGAAPGAEVLAVAAFAADDDGRPLSSTALLVRALDVARAGGARVVNMSFAGGADPLVGAALDALARRGVVLVAAAGNGGPGAPPAFPGAHPGVIAATATDAADALYPRANRGAYVALAAPGVDLLAPGAQGRYTLGSGTSLAAAYVAAAAALALEARPDASPADVAAALGASARDLGAPGRDPDFGHGLAAPAAALARLAEGGAGR